MSTTYISKVAFDQTVYRPDPVAFEFLMDDSRRGSDTSKPITLIASSGAFLCRMRMTPADARRLADELHYVADLADAKTGDWGISDAELKANLREQADRRAKT